MPYSINQGTVGAASARLGNLVLPSGPYTLILSNAGSASPVWLGAGGTGVTPGNGFPLPASVTPLVFSGFHLNLLGTVFAVAGASAGTANVGWILITPSGGTGL